MGIPVLYAVIFCKCCCSGMMIAQHLSHYLLLYHLSCCACHVVPVCVRYIGVSLDGLVAHVVVSDRGGGEITNLVVFTLPKTTSHDM